jgi:hypothetical protein
VYEWGNVTTVEEEAMAPMKQMNVQSLGCMMARIVVQ